MADLDPQVQIKLIEISKEWAVMASSGTRADNVQNVLPAKFDTIYKQLVKTMSEK